MRHERGPLRSSIDQWPEHPSAIDSAALRLLSVGQLAHDLKTGVPLEQMVEVNDSPGVRAVRVVVPATSQDLITCIPAEVEDGPLIGEDMRADVALRVAHPPTVLRPPSDCTIRGRSGRSPACCSRERMGVRWSPLRGAHGLGRGS